MVQSSSSTHPTKQKRDSIYVQHRDSNIVLYYDGRGNRRMYRCFLTYNNITCLTPSIFAYPVPRGYILGIRFFFSPATLLARLHVLIHCRYRYAHPTSTINPTDHRHHRATAADDTRSTRCSLKNNTLEYFFFFMISIRNSTIIIISRMCVL